MKQSMSIKHIAQTFAIVVLLGFGAAQAQEIAVVVSPSSPLLKEQLSDIFLGKNTDSRPVDLPESSPIRTGFYSKATGKDASQVKAIWVRLVFSGKAQPPKEMPDAAAVKKAVAADPKAVGYIEKGAVDGTVKVLTTLN